MPVCRILLLALLLIVLPSLGRTQAVTLSLVRVPCDSGEAPMLPPPSSDAERQKIEANWSGPDELEVDAWGAETAASRIDPNSAKVKVEGKLITLAFSHRKTVVSGDSQESPTCTTLVKLFFIISQLPKTHYQLQIDDGRIAARPREVEG
jgi:hypothetical protein